MYIVNNRIYHSLTTPFLFFGCESSVFLPLICIDGVIIFYFQSLIYCLLVLISSVAIIAMVRGINANDPQFFRGFYRYLFSYQNYYCAHTLYSTYKK